MRFREHRGSLRRSMLTLVDLPDVEALRAHCEIVLGHPVSSDALVITPYTGPDDRIGWPRTCMVLVAGEPVGFCDTLPEPKG